jgi:hypothetical protein
MDEKSFLLNLLNLSDGILKNDTNLINTTVANFNSAELTEPQKVKIKENVYNFMNGDTTVSEDTLRNVINSLNCLNKPYLNAVVDLKFVDINGKEGLKTFVTNKLADTKIVFDSDTDKYSYYYQLSNLAIVTRDVSVIEKAIETVQKL